MNTALRQALIKCETDLEGASRRFSGDDALYTTCLHAFLDDKTMEDLDIAIRTGTWDDAFTAAHAMKGLAGNMGFVPLFHATAELVVLIRTGRTEDIDASYRQMKRCYAEIMQAIRDHNESTVVKGE